MAQPDITVTEQSAFPEARYRVCVEQEGRASEHAVVLREDYYQRLAHAGFAGPPEELISRSFSFLLAREPKESILPEFELSVIGHYFPEYEREITQTPA